MSKKSTLRRVKARSLLTAKASKSDLMREVGGPVLGGVRRAFDETSVVAGLTPQKLARLLRAVDSGDPESYLTLAMEMEERDAHYGSILATRKRAVQSLPVMIKPGDETPKAQEIAEAVQAYVIDQPEFGDLLAHGLDALGKGFAVVEHIWGYGAGGNVMMPVAYEWRDPRWFKIDQVDGRTVRLMSQQNPLGEDLQRYKWSIHTPRQKSGLPIRSGLARLSAWSYLFKNYAVKDWVTFAEAYGMPLRLGKYDPSATEEDKEVLFRAVRGLGVDQAAIVPQSMTIEFQQAMSGSATQTIFQALADWCDRQMSKAVLGATMITDEGSSGGYAQSKTHDGVRETIRDDDAAQLARTVNAGIVRDFVDLNFGPQDFYPRVSLQTEADEALTDWLERVERAVKLGLPIGQETLYQKLGLEPPTTGEALLGAPSAAPADETGAGASSERGLARILKHLARAKPDGADVIDLLVDEALADWQPQMDGLIEPILKAAEDATSAEEFEARLNTLRLGTDPLARALAREMFKARGLGDGTDKV